MVLSFWTKALLLLWDVFFLVAEHLSENSLHFHSLLAGKTQHFLSESSLEQD